MRNVVFQQVLARSTSTNIETDYERQMKSGGKRDLN